MEIFDFEIKLNAAPLQQIELPNNSKGVRIFIKREDLLHPIVSGNKWRKLKYNLLEAKERGFSTLLTFGGAYSNHLYATSYAGKIFGFKTIGIIRGEEHLPLNPTLKFVESQGMETHYVNRKSYRQKGEDYFIEKLYNKFGEFYLLPEGGTNILAVKGCTEIIDDIEREYDYILTACGTGGTIAGLICGLKGKRKVFGIPVLKGANFLKDKISNYIRGFANRLYNNWELNFEFHFGGYAKISKELIQFINEFEKINRIALDPIYTGKLLYAVNSLLGNGKFKNGSTVIVLHTGGLQGIAGMKSKVDKLLS